jgi:hypothetical protein
MKKLFRKVVAFFRREWFLTIMLIIIGVIITLYKMIS